jgi:hypothetical protein
MPIHARTPESCRRWWPPLAAVDHPVQEHALLEPLVETCETVKWPTHRSGMASLWSNARGTSEAEDPVDTWPGTSASLSGGGKWVDVTAGEGRRRPVHITTKIVGRLTKHHHLSFFWHETTDLD